MGMNKVPTLILGIGGIGCRIAANINDLLSAEDKKYVSVIGLDTNVNDLQILSKRSIKTIQTSDNRSVRDYLAMHPEYMKWFPVNQYTVSKNMINGAGQIRAVSRLAALASEESGRFTPIKEEIQRIRTDNGNITVMIVGSITGGTGAGMFLQLPYYVRKILKGEAGLDNIIIRGLFIGPDFTVDVQPSKINRDAVRVNGYSCLKELNALYMRQTHTEQPGGMYVDFFSLPDPDERKSVAQDMRRKLETDFYDEDDGFDIDELREDTRTISLGNPAIPYDYLYLIENSHASGTVGNAPLPSVESLTARMVFTLLCTPVSDNALSVEDNLVLQDMEYGGMNRYSSAGLTRLIYPKDLAQEYVTLTVVRDLVRDEWMLIDEEYNNVVSTARDRQRTDGHVEIPKIKNEYVALYEKQVKKGRLGKLYNEAFYVTPDRIECNKADRFMGWLEDIVADIVGSDEVVSLQNACELSDSKTDTFDAASTEFSRVFYALEDYRKYAKRLVSEKGAEIANTLFQPSWRSMALTKEEEKSVYQLLCGVHPITARYLCYSLINKLEAKISELDGLFAGINLDDYYEEDYDPKEPGTQDALSALRIAQEHQIPVLGQLMGEAGKIKKIRNRVRGVAESQCALITDYITTGITLSAAKIILKRVEKLADNYRIFFLSIEEMIEENNARISRLENLVMPLGQEGVYCSKEAFVAMATEYRNANDNELPETTKTAIFESIFKVLATDFENEGKFETEHQKAVRAKKKAEDLANIFNEAVIDTIRTDILKNSAGIVDMTIMQALEKEYNLVLPEGDDLTSYIRKRVEHAMRKATPLLAVSSNAMAQNVESVYLTINPDCAAAEMGKPSAAATQNLLIPQACEATDNVRPSVLMNSSFSPYEISCFKARYKFSIEDLVKYYPDSENAKAYNIRIANQGKTPLNTNDPDEFKTVVSPHLDRHWHEEAYLPSIYAVTRRRDRENTRKAFIYAIGRDYFKRMKDDSVLDESGTDYRLLWFFESNAGFVPVKVRNKYVGTSFTNLYESIPFCGKIKRQILSKAQKAAASEKGFCVAEELKEKIFENDFVKDLIQPTVDINGDGEGNILDIFLRMRETMENEEWLALVNTLIEVIWEFCAYMFDENEKYVNAVSRKIIENILANSSLSEKADLTVTEKELLNQVEKMRTAIYRRK